MKKKTFTAKFAGLALPFLLVGNADTLSGEDALQKYIYNSAANPIVDSCQGDHQFTLVRDGDHSSPLINQEILKSLKGCAEVGIRHVILEFPYISNKRMEERFPDLKNKTSGEKLTFLNQELDLFNKRLSDVHILPNIQYDIMQIPYDKNTSSWSREYDQLVDHAKIEFFLENSDIKLKEQELLIFRQSVLVNDLLDRWYGYDPDVTQDVVYKYAQYFESTNAKTERARKISGETMADIIIQSRDLGIRVHFSGDYQDAGTYFVFDYYARALEALSEQGDNEYIQRKIGRLFDESAKRFFDTRMSSEQERKRAERFVEVAEGERALVLWGDNHFANVYLRDKDLDEFLDELTENRAKQIALYPSLQAYTDRLKNAEEEHNGSKPRPAQQVYFIEDGKMLSYPDRIFANFMSSEPSV